MRTIQLEVSDEVAEKVQQLTQEQRQELTRLIMVWANNPKPLLQVMAEISEYAQQQGLTPEILEELLKDE